MELICSRQALLEGVEIVGRILPGVKRTSLPLLLRAKESSLELWATDLNVGIAYRLEAEVTEPGIITVPGGFLGKALQALRCDHAQLKVKASDILSLQCHGFDITIFDITINGEGAEQFPLMPRMPEGPWIRLDAEIFRQSLGQTYIAAYRKQDKPLLTGVLLKVDGKKLTAVAADGFRLSVVTCELFEPVQPEKVIVPAGVLLRFARSIQGQKREVAFCVVPEHQQVFFRAKDIWLVSHIIQGQFPDHEALIPVLHRTYAIMDRKALATAVKAVHIFAKEAAFTAHLHLIPSKTGEKVGSVEVIAIAQDFGTSTITIPANVEGAEGEIAFNSKYLVDLLSVVNTDKVGLLINRSHEPGLFRPLGQEESFIHVLMPLHVKRVCMA